MILTGPRIEEEVSAGRITIDPYEPSQRNPNSYDFRLHHEILVYTERKLDAARENPTESMILSDRGYLLEPDRVYLGATSEVMGSEYFVPIIRGKSSLGRLGLFVHMTADLIDLGEAQRWTLQMHVVQPLRIYPGMRIGQVTFWVPMGTRTSYSGKYRNSSGPRASQSFRDFDQEPK